MAGYIGGYHWYRYVEGFEWEPRYVKKTRKLQWTGGVELEIDGGGTNEQNAYEITRAIGFPCAPNKFDILCSTDGSLSNGFEMVFQPASLDYYMTKKYDMEAGLAKAEELGYSSWDAGTCGLHVHVGRNYFMENTSNPEEVLAIVLQNNQTEIAKISGRSNFHYCKMPQTSEKVWSYKLKTSEQPDEMERIAATLGYQKRDRYHALNFENDNTIEFRFFRGTLNYTRFIADLQFIKMFSDVGRNFSLEQACNVKWAWFIQYAKAQRYKEFVYLSNHYGLA